MVSRHEGMQSDNPRPRGNAPIISKSVLRPRTSLTFEPKSRPLIPETQIYARSHLVAGTKVVLLESTTALWLSLSLKTKTNI